MRTEGAVGDSPGFLGPLAAAFPQMQPLVAFAGLLGHEGFKHVRTLALPEKQQARHRSFDGRVEGAERRGQSGLRCWARSAKRRGASPETLYDLRKRRAGAPLFSGIRSQTGAGARLWLAQRAPRCQRVLERCRKLASPSFAVPAQRDHEKRGRCGCRCACRARRAAMRRSFPMRHSAAALARV